MSESRHSLVIPVYRNAATIDPLLQAVEEIATGLGTEDLEVIFVVDGSDDDSYARLSSRLPGRPFQAVLVELSRNYGAFAAIRHGLALASGEYIAVMAADLQEPPDLIERFYGQLALGDCDVVLGRREGRDEGWGKRTSSAIFWWLYRKLVQPEMPAGGVDVFAITAGVRNALIRLEPRNTSLVGQLIWLGYRRREVPYTRRSSLDGGSQWTLRKRFVYMVDSVLSFTDLPLRLLTLIGAVGVLLTVGGSLLVVVAYLRGAIRVPGYTPLILAIMFATFSILTALGILGAYVWRIFDNSKARPPAFEMRREDFPGDSR